MNFDWNDLQFFLAIERAGTARAAALKLETSHSTVMRRLQNLEEVFGSTLFDRTPDGFVLTEAGGHILERAQSIESDVQQMTKDVEGSDIRLEGPIRLTAPPPLIQHLLLPHLNAFRLEFPLIELELVATYEVTDLDRRDADIAIRFSEHPAEHLVGRRMPVFNESIYASEKYIISHDFTSEGRSGKPKPEWIAWPEVKSFAKRIKSTPFVDTPITWRLPGFDIQRAAAHEQIGMVMLPCSIGDKDEKLKRVPRAGLYPTMPVWLLTHPNLRKLERVRVFSKFLAGAITAEKELIAGNKPRK